MGAKKQDVELFFTDDLDQFVLSSANRRVYPQHVRRMATSIAQNGFLRDCPIKVVKKGNQFIVTDGQHRLEAARTLGVGVYFMPDIDTQVAAKIRVANQFSRSWSLDDYLHHHISLENENYVELKKFAEKFKLPPSVALDILSGRNMMGPRNGLLPRDFRAAFKDGSWSIDPDRLVQAEELMKRINEIRFFHEVMGTVRYEKSFISALVRVLNNPDFDYARFMQNLPVQLDRIRRCSNTARYLEMLSEIYNYRRAYENRVQLR
jgi:hypothetical protein